MERRLKPFPMPPSETHSGTPEPDTANSQLPHYPIAKRPRPNWFKWLIPALVLLIVVAGGVYGWHTIHKAGPKHPTAVTNTVKPAQNAPNQIALTKYVSNGQDLNLAFSYPSDWSVSPPSNDNTSDQTITVTSPIETIESASSKSVTGKAIVLIRPGTAQISELASGNAAAGQTSVQIGYTQPLTSQQQYPYLSFINLPGGTNASGNFQEVIVTGEQIFSQGQSIVAADLSSLDPIISASFYSCSTRACSGSGQTPLSITMTNWQNAAPFTQVLALIQSLQLH